MILHNCGSSSRLDFLRKGPIGVRYSSGFDNRWVATAGVSIRIVLNFGILKILSPIPTRSDQYNAGRLEVSLSKIAITSMGSNKTGINQRESSK